MSRSAERNALDNSTRFLLAERDLDDHESDIKAFDERLGKMLWTTVVTLLTLVLLVVTTPRIFSSANNSEEVRRGNEIAACRSQWRTRVDDAMSQVLAKKSELDILTNEGLQASVAKDNDALLATTLEAPEKRDAVMTAVNNLTTAIDDYRAAVDKSIDDSDAFLTECRKIRGSN